MKRIGCLILALGLLLLCACMPIDYVGKLDGVWRGEETEEVMWPLAGARVLTFMDGVLSVEGGSGAGEYTVSANDDTLTISRLGGEGAFGVSYRLKGDRLILCGKLEFLLVE